MVSDCCVVFVVVINSTIAIHRLQPTHERSSGSNASLHFATMILCVVYGHANGENELWFIIGVVDVIDFHMDAYHIYIYMIGDTILAMYFLYSFSPIHTL